MNCMFCGKKLSGEEESNFIHYPNDKVCDDCMKEKLCDKQERRF